MKLREIFGNNEQYALAIPDAGNPDQIDLTRHNDYSDDEFELISTDTLPFDQLDEDTRRLLVDLCDEDPTAQGEYDKFTRWELRGVDDRGRTYYVDMYRGELWD